jgi:putative addiction module component (TIGR02574 family)
MHTTYHIRIKKEYAAELIEDLQKVDAVEFLAGQEEDMDISQAQMDEVKRRIEYYDKNPHELISWEDVRKRLKFD